MRVRRLRARKAMGNVALAGAVVFVIGGYFAIQKTVTLVVEGQPEAVRTMSASVGQLLDAQGIAVGDRALVFPPATTPLADGMTVVVEHRYYASELDAAAASLLELATPEASTDVGAWVMEGVDGSAALLAARSTEDWFSADGPIGSTDAVAAVVVVLGKDHDVLTNATTVGELLSAMGIDPDRDDRVSPSPSAPLHPGVRIRFVQVDHRLRDVEIAIPFTTHSTFTDQLKPGEVRITQAGVDGLMRERYRVKLVDGEVVSRALLSRAVLEVAVPQERQVGRRPLHTATSGTHGSQVGEASRYSFAPGDGLTAAHPWLPFGTVVSVTNLANGRTVQVVINDRGPFGGRIIDLSNEAFARIAPLGQGVARVRITW
jgi:uncharacterized protein YabE (DUF348 family)